MRTSYAVIAPTFTYPDKARTKLGQMQSRHWTAAAAHREMQRRQRVNAAANPDTELMLEVIEIEWMSRRPAARAGYWNAEARGRVVNAAGIYS